MMSARTARTLKPVFQVLCGACALLGPIFPTSAHADDAVVSVGPVEDESRYADPPPRRREAIAIDDRAPYGDERFRSEFRLVLGPSAVTTGRGLGLGLGLGLDFGTGTVGLRASVAWTRGEGGDPAATPLGDSVAQYLGEVTLDLHKRGPWHPIVAAGFGLAHVSKPTGNGDAGIGTARIALEYALPVDDADVRLGAGVLGAITGPEDREVSDLRAYALFGTTLAVGF